MIIAFTIAKIIIAIYGIRGALAFSEDIIKYYNKKFKK
jgi:hypothetical protein